MTVQTSVNAAMPVDAGDLLTGNNAGASQILIVGGDGQILSANSMQPAGLEWINNDVQPTAKGSLTAGTGTGAGLLAVGANGDILTADSTQALGLRWAAPPTNKWASAYAHFIAQSPTIIVGSFNISSITYDGSAFCTVNFLLPLSTPNYIVLIDTTNSSIASSAFNRTVNSFKLQSGNPGVIVDFVVFGG